MSPALASAAPAPLPDPSQDQAVASAPMPRPDPSDAQPPASTPGPGPDTTPPQPAAGAAPSHHFGPLLVLVRRLLQYGKELAAIVRQPPPHAPLLAFIQIFGAGIGVPAILARITRGLCRAAALHDRLIDLTAQELKRLAAGRPAPDRAGAMRAMPAPRGAPAQPVLRGEARLAAMTLEQILASDRRRPIGAVLADICRDLGVHPGDSLAQDVVMPIIANSGNYNALWVDTYKRLHSWPTFPPLPLTTWPGQDPLEYAGWLKRLEEYCTRPP